MKTCGKCGANIDDPRLIACPECRRNLSQSSSSLTPEQEEYIVNKLWKKLWKFLVGGFSVLAIISLLLLVSGLIKAYNRGITKLEDTLVSKISDEFETSKITETVRSVAEKKATDMLTNRIMPVVDDFKKSIQTYLNEVAEMAKPPTLSLNAKEVNENGGVYQAIIQFKPSKDVPLGRLDFLIKIISDNDTIIASAIPKHGGYMGGAGSISKDGKQVSLSFGIIGGGNHPTIEIHLSGEALLQITGNKITEPVVVKVNNPY